MKAVNKQKRKKWAEEYMNIDYRERARERDEESGLRRESEERYGEVPPNTAAYTVFLPI